MILRSHHQKKWRISNKKIDRVKSSTVPIERWHVRSGERITVPYKKLDSVWTQPLHFLPKTLLKPSVSFAYACSWLFVEFNFYRKLMFILSCYIEEPKGNSSGYLSSVLNWTTYSVDWKISSRLFFIRKCISTFKCIHYYVGLDTRNVRRLMNVKHKSVMCSFSLNY